MSCDWTRAIPALAGSSKPVPGADKAGGQGQPQAARTPRVALTGGRAPAIEKLYNADHHNVSALPRGTGWPRPRKARARGEAQGSGPAPAGRGLHTLPLPHQSQEPSLHKSPSSNNESSHLIPQILPGIGVPFTRASRDSSVGSQPSRATVKIKAMNGRLKPPAGWVARAGATSEPSNG